MDSTQKGDKLENQVFDVYKSQITENCFFCKSEYCKIFRKKGYYSKDREKDIIFDISIEVTLPGNNRYSLLFLIECKNYNHSVPVDDIEEFFSKIQQISGANAKGIVVTTNSFQESAFKFARSKGIGLLRYFNNERLECVLERSASSMASANYIVSERSNAFNALHNENYNSRYFDFYGFVNELYTASSNQFFSSLAKICAEPDVLESLTLIAQATQESRLPIPYLESLEVEDSALNMLSDIQYVSGSVPLDAICGQLNEKFGLIVKRNTQLRKGVLGKISFDPDIISIDDNQASTIKRSRFTLAHELGHFYLNHGKFMSRESCYKEEVDTNNIGSIDLNDVRRMEWQANYFASCLLLPKEQFKKEFYKQTLLHGLSNHGHGLLYLDDQKCNIENFLKVTASLKHTFEVSRRVIKIRLQKLGLLNDVQKMPSKAFQSKRSLLQMLD